MDEGNTARIAELDEELEKVFYGFIVPVDGTSDIQAVLKKQPFPVVKAFSKMIKEQLAVD